MSELINGGFKSSLPSNAFRKMLDRLPRLVMLIDLNGQIVYWNTGGKEVFGYSSEERLGKPVWFLYPERSEGDFKEDLILLEEGELISEEMKGGHKDGSTVWVDVKRRIIRLNAGERYILGSASDISVQKQAEIDLANNEKRLKSILETAVEGIITIDKRGAILSFNQAAENIFGYTADEVKGKNVSILMPSPFHRHHDEYIQNYLRTGERKIIGIGREVRGMRKDGTIFPMGLAVSEVDLQDQIIFTGFVRDISDKRKLENEILQTSEEERQRIGRELHDGLGQMLTGIGMIGQNLARKLEEQGSPFTEDAREIYQMIREADHEAKSLAHGLVHIELEEGGLEKALHLLCKRAHRLFEIDCRINLSGGGIEIKDKMTNLHLYRIVQEAISNAVKHGKASCVEVLMEKGPDQVRLIVKDDGVGFDKPVNLQEFEGLGVHTMHYRVHMMGGHFEIDLLEKGGIKIVCTFPLDILQSESSK